MGADGTWDTTINPHTIYWGEGVAFDVQDFVNFFELPREAAEEMFAELKERLNDQELLRRYIDHVGNCEGVDFIDRIIVEHSEFTQEEVDRLNVLGG
jgi:hypothetical protein